MLFRFNQFFYFILRNLCGNILDRFRKQFPQIGIFKRFTDKLWSVCAGYNLQVSQNHLRMLLKIRIDTDGSILRLSLFIRKIISLENIYIHPCRQFCTSRIFFLLQKQNIRIDDSSCIFQKSIVRKTNRT